MIFNENKNIQVYFLEYIKHIFEDLINDEFYEEFNKIPHVKIAFAAITSELKRMNSLIEGFHGHITKRFIKDIIKDHIHNEDHVFMSTRVYSSTNDEGIMNIKKFMLLVNTKMLCCDILDFITALDVYKEYLKLTIRHEIGHMIDEISYDGMPKSVVSKHTKQIMIDYDNFHKAFGDFKETEYLREYHNIPHERNADILGKVDLEEMLRLDRYLKETKKSNVGFKIKVIDKS